MLLQLLPLLLLQCLSKTELGPMFRVELDRFSSDRVSRNYLVPVLKTTFELVLSGSGVND